MGLEATDVTPEEAKKIWDTFEDPTPRKVARALASTGRIVGSATIQRWHDNDWIRKTQGPKVFDIAESNIDVNIGVLTKNPRVRLRQLVPYTDSFTDAIRPQPSSRPSSTTQNSQPCKQRTSG